MTKMSRLTPFSRALISIAAVGGVLFFLKTFVFNGKTNASGDNTTITGTASGAVALLRLSGSSTLGAKMIPQIASDFMTTELAATAVSIQQISATETEVVGTINGEQRMISISTGGSLQGISDLDAQKADIALYSGAPDALTNTANEPHVLALDGIAVITAKTNKIKELSKAQVADIFMGKITDWAQIGGQAGKINCVGRDAQSGTSEAFKQLVFENATATLPTNVTLMADSKALVNTVENDPQAIGFTSFSAIGNTQALGLSDAGTAVRYPSVFTIQTEDYLLTRRLVLLANANSHAPVNDYIARFIAFCNDDSKGQKTVASSGFVNMDLSNIGTAVAIADAPPAYLEATNGASRLPTALHFKSGTAAPDSRATDDIQRVMRILTLSQNRQKQVLLIGFTDNVGNPTQNITLSTQRAASIQAEFAKFGVQTQTFGFGQALPIASNASAVGQNKNRRVEVWLK